jgi:ElaB/YqjD/DUF883 family membrane-anchored ribosome-binding protein
MEKSEIQAIRVSMEKNLEGFMNNARNLIRVSCGEPEEKGCREWAQEQLEILKKQYQGFGDRVRPGMDRTQAMVKEHPYLAAGALAGAGLGLAAVSFMVAKKKR